MSVIRKLLIQGIRSFDPQNQDIIEFYTPLTIIVGQNGCGKTTIIECLKYITTGELPPNSKGGAFIHDPKLAGEKEVKAQVKLRFLNISQRSMTCVRSILLSQKKTTMTQKTLEGALSFDATATDEKVSISSRCADLDAMIPEQLGVSKAVLENVIFCHQEESNWPLSEASVLKKKFDEIFAATRYTKALESIKAIRKNQAVEIRVQRNELKHLEDKRAKSERVRAEHSKSTAAIREFKVQMESILREEELVTAQIDGLTKQIQEVWQLENVITGYQTSLDQKVSSYEEMAANTVVLDLSDDELRHLMVEIASQIETQDSDIQGRVSERDQLKAQVEEMARQISSAMDEKSRLQSTQHSLEMKINSRSAAASDICKEFGIVLADSAHETAEELALQCTSELEKLLVMAEQERQTVQRQSNETERQLQSEIDTTQAKVNALNVTIAACDKQKAANEQEIRAIGQKHDSLKVEASQIQSLEAEIEAEQEQLAKAQSQDSEAAYNDKTKQSRLELAQISDEIAELQAEIARNNQQASTLARLDMARKSLEASAPQITTLAADPELAAYGNGVSGSDCKSAIATGDSMTEKINKAIQDKKQAIAEWSDKAKQCHEELSSTRARLDLAQQSYERQEREIAAKSKRIASVCGTTPFDTAYADAQADLQELLEMAGHYKSVSSMYKAYIQKIEADHACPVCQRGWSNKSDEEKLVSKLRLDFTAAPAELLKITSDTQQSERRLEELSGLQSIVRDVKDWTGGQASDLEAQIAQLKVTAETLSTRADDLDVETALATTDLDSLAEVLVKAQQLAALESSAHQARQQIEHLERELQATGSTKTIDELQAQVASLQARDTVVRRELERTSQEFVRRQREIGFRQESIRHIKDKLAMYSRQADERESLIKRISELELDIEASLCERQGASEQAEALAPQLQREQQRLADFRSEARQREAHVDQRVRSVMQSKDRLLMLSREIEDTRKVLQCAPGETRFRDRLEMAAARLGELSCKEKEMRSQLDVVLQAILESDRVSDKLAAKQRQVSDNLRLRTNKAEQTQIHSDLQTAHAQKAQLEAKLDQIYKDVEGDDGEQKQGVSGRKRRRLSNENSHDSDGDYEGSGSSTSAPRSRSWLQRRREVLNQRLSRLTSKRAGLHGEVKQLEDQTQRLGRELSTDYKDIDQLYVRQLVQCKTEELASSDLETYGKALDAAIMRYHSLKMQDINKIIRELWINTYQGNDIDTIEIRSEVEGARNSRSHNYRVVMIKAGHAIDMRGRCSAGQKVLACLIIRLALAETFSVNCGILALDEPTTNLDQENIDSLARSLARIIKSRQEQRNFQLIVITHDEIFMQLLGKSEYADYYWRVYKDENQCSVFARRPIANN
ncbi:DNA repair protein rad50 [Coemansia sp. Benny D115]|nr:DNA repair protein rad50 [Coemansia sp. Benny D115]